MTVYTNLKINCRLLSFLVILFFSLVGLNAHGADRETLNKKLSVEALEKIRVFNLPKDSLNIASNNKFSSGLQQLMLEKRPQANVFKNPMLRFKGDNVVQAYIKLAEPIKETAVKLENFVVSIDLVNEDLNLAQAWVNVNDLERLSEENWIVNIKEPSYGRNRVGSRQTEGDAILRSNIVRNLGITGRGIKVGIISDGANDWRQAAASGDLPNKVQLFGTCDKAFSTCNEGTAMAEIIHDIAPDAELAVGSGVGSTLEFIQALNQLVNVFDADIIVDDIGFFAEPYFEDGDVAQAVTNLPADILYFSAAGNENGIHYESPLRISSDFRNGGLHDFDASGVEDVEQGFLVAPNSSVVVILQSSQPFNSTAQISLDLFVTNIAGDIIAFDLGIDRPIAAAAVQNNTSQTATFFVLIRRSAGIGAGNPRIEMFHLGSPGIEHAVAANAIFGHPATNRAIAVAAIDAADQGNDDAQSFSSRGPSTVFRPSFEVRQKPDIAAIDGVSVTGTGGFPNRFFGTSAAAPHAAGVAALLLSVGSHITSQDVEVAMKSSARGVFNTILGAGLINAELAFNELPDELLDAEFLPAILYLLSNQEDSR